MMAIWTLLLAADPDPAVLKGAVERLRSTQRVLYVAAHPDDENTRLLAYLTGGRGVEAAYLSLTRGGGGQNVIGDEQGGLLSVLRTEELLAARRIDGARQYFTRARDFGYSKSAEETLRIWSEQQVVQDAVRVVRSFRPDVIVTRFRPQGDTHGHHLASARIAQLAFELAGDLSYGAVDLPPWKGTRLLVNVPRWRNEDDTGDFAIDVSGWSILRGASHSEIAARSRSMHRSQAFGSAPTRGPQLEYFENVFGARAEKDLLEGVPFGWSRFEGGEAVDAALAAASSALSFTPSAALRELLTARRALTRLEPGLVRVQDGLRILDEVIAGALGLWAQVEAPEVVVPQGEAATFQVRLLQPLGPALRLLSVTLAGHRHGLDRAPLELGALAEVSVRPPLPPRPLGTPAWLIQAPSAGSYVVPPSEDPTAPDHPMTATLEFALDGQTLQIERPVVHPRVDRTRGEQLDPVAALPSLVAEALDEVVWADGSVVLAWRVEAIGGPVQARLRPGGPSGWRVTPGARTIELEAGASTEIRFTVEPAEGAEPASVDLLALSLAGGQTSSLEGGQNSSSEGEENSSSEGEGGGEAPALLARGRIAYPHIRPRVILSPAAIRVAPIQRAKVKARVGYLMGSGDRIPEALSGLGVDVRVLDDEALAAHRFDGLDVIVLGVRAHNVRPEVTEAESALFDWVEGGGRLIVQYNTNSWYSKLEARIGPAPISVDRTRVTDETSPVELLEPRHPFLRDPHVIEPADFEGWVQERGLYFAHEWDEAWTPLLELTDPAEAPTRGSLLVLEHGRGEVVFTGLSFFRQLPAGVPGAARLFLNLLGAKR